MPRQGSGICAGTGHLYRRRRQTYNRAENDLAVLHIDDHGLADVELLPQDALRERVLDQLLDGPAQRPRAQLRVVALLGQQLLGRRGELQPDALVLQLLADPPDHQVDDLDDLVPGQLVEDDDLVDPVEELGAEVRL